VSFCGRIDKEGGGGGHLVEARKVRQFPGIVRQCAHDPVRVRLPGRVQDSVERIEQTVPREIRVVNVHTTEPRRRLCLVRRARDPELGLEPAAPDGEDQHEEERPASDRAAAARHKRVVKEPAEEEGSDDLCEPVPESGECAGARVEHIQIVCVLLVGVEPFFSPVSLRCVS